MILGPSFKLDSMMQQGGTPDRKCDRMGMIRDGGVVLTERKEFAGLKHDSELIEIDLLVSEIVEIKFFRH